MTWARFDDNFPEHPKVVQLSDRAFRVHVTAICYATRHNTDGHVPAGVASRVGATRKPLGELIGAGLWHENGEGGWIVHDFLDYNLSRAQRAARATSGEKGGQQSPKMHGKQNTSTRLSKRQAKHKQRTGQNGS